MAMSEEMLMLPQLGRDERLASQDLLPLVYQELRRLAAARMLRETPGHTLQPTALVHEVWLRLVGDPELSWENRAHFFGAAAQAMRRVLVDRSRRKAALKRQAADQQAAAPGEDPAAPEPEDHILMIHESLKRLEREDPDAAHIVLLKFFSGRSSTEIARMCGSSVRSVERRWTLAKAKLYQMIRDDGF